MSSAITLPVVRRGTLSCRELGELLGCSAQHIRTNVAKFEAELGTKAIQSKPGVWLWPLRDLAARGLLIVDDDTAPVVLGGAA